MSKCVRTVSWRFRNKICNKRGQERPASACRSLLFEGGKMSRMHWWIMAVGAVFFLWFFIPAFVVVNIGNITGMAVSALVLLYGIFYRQVQDVAGRLWQTRGGRAGLSALGMVLLFILLIVTVETAGMIRSAANRAPENTTAVVLGCSVKGSGRAGC